MSLLCCCHLCYSTIQYCCCCITARVGHLFILLHPIQHNPQTHWPDPIIQSMMCIHVPTHIHSNPSNPRQGKQSVQHFELMYAVNEMNNDYSNKKSVLSQRWPRDARYINGSNEPLRRYGHSKLSKMAACRQLGFDVTGNSAIRSADPENPTLEPNMKCIGSPVAEIWPPFPQNGEGEVVGDQWWHHSKERWWFPISSPLWPLRYL